jgi:hypothetical protein
MDDLTGWSTVWNGPRLVHIDCTALNVLGLGLCFADSEYLRHFPLLCYVVRVIVLFCLAKVRVLPWV